MLSNIIKKQISDIDDKLFGLTDYHIKALHYFLKNIIKLEYYNIEIDTNKKEVRIQPTDQTGKSVKIPVSQDDKNAVSLFLTKKLNIDGKVNFL